MASAATEQIQQARASHDQLLSTASESIPESVEDLQAERLSIMAKLKQEVEAKEDMQVELHKMQGRDRVGQCCIFNEKETYFGRLIDGEICRSCRLC